MTNESKLSERSRYRVPILDRALALVNLLGAYPEGLTVTELGEMLEIPKNSAFRIAVTLEENGYLERLEQGKRYRLTPKFMMLGASALSEHNLFEKSLDVMRSVRDKLRETVLLGTRVGCEGVVLDQVPGLHPFRFAVDPGVRFDLHTAAPGKAILAFLPEDERRGVLERMTFKRYTENTITDPEKFAIQLEQVRDVGYGFDLSEEIEGQYCIGAPVLDGRGYPIASIWITAPSSRLADSELDTVGRAIRKKSEIISRRFGWNPSPQYS